jgi:molybdopterin-containing oxidoreductase family iron-sulfur binding subunit
VKPPRARGRPIGRRAFLAAAGAAGVAAGCSPRTAAERLVPWLVPPRDAVPGVPLWYRTTCRECSAGCGVTARTLDGRAVKLEGNPEDPVGRGALCARGQAALQALYHPARFGGPRRRGEDGALAPLAWDRAEEELARAIAAAAARGPGRVRLVTRPEPGAAGAVQRAFLEAIGGRAGDRVVLAPLDPEPVRAASAALLGRREVPVLDLSRARSVVAFGADLLETWGSPVEQARHLAEGRGTVGEARTRLTWVGPRLSLTGASADRWLRARAGGEVAVALGVLKVLLDPASGVRGLAPEAGALAPRTAALDPAALAGRAGVPWAEIEALGRELAARRPSALVGPGPAAQGPEATRLAGLVALANHLLGNVGATVLHGLSPGRDADPPSRGAELAALVADLAAGEVDVLLVQGADLAGALPAALGVAAALERVPLVASFASRPDATTARAHLVLPDHHALESPGDVSPRRGVQNALQPVMTPLADTRAAPQVLLEVAGRLPAARRLPWTDFREVVASRLVAGEDAASAPAALRATLQRGGRWTAAAPEAPRLDVRAAAALLAAPAPAPAPGPGSLELVPFPTALRSGGALGWLREVPDALTSVSWTPWLELSPATAARLGLATGDLAAVETAAGRAELPVYVFPGIRDDAAGLPLGGPEALAILPWRLDAASGAPVLAGDAAAVRAARRKALLPLLEGSPYQHGREIVPAVSAAAPALARPRVGAPAADPPHPEHRWAMAIDLDRCTGCQACAVACHAENNVPVMGPEAAAAGRYMGWIRIERYLGDAPGAALDVRLLPMLCQQCTSAPCEPVCPVYATYHTREGLNAQVYNRCIGTRYCSNNCPYKVRTFNWRDARFERPLELQLNPEVTVRSRGVMEKCTFCIQRIRHAEERAKAEGRAVADGEIVPACAQTCPARAIVFGDALDPGSGVSRLARDPRGFAVLEDLGTRPAITYLAPVRDRGHA